jgi:hypothetical protein
LTWQRSLCRCDNLLLPEGADRSSVTRCRLGVADGKGSAGAGDNRGVKIVAILYVRSFCKIKIVVAALQTMIKMQVPFTMPNLGTVRANSLSKPVAINV